MLAGLAAPTVLSGAMLGARAAFALTQQQEVLDKARISFDKLITSVEFGELPGYMKRAKAALIFPELYKGGFILGAEGGYGILVARSGDGWSQPAFYDLAEQHFGDWQGLTYEELESVRGYHRFWHAPASERPPGGESFEDVVARVAGAIERITAEHAGRDIVAVVHGGTIRAALALALGVEPERTLGFSIDTCSVTRMDHLAGGTQGAAWRIVAVNQHPEALTR